MKKLREGGSETQRPAQTVTSVEEPALNPLPRFVMGWTYPKTTSWRGASLVGRSPLCGLPAEQPWVGHGLRAAGQSGQALLGDVRLGNSSITCTSIDRDNTFEATRYDFIAEASRTEAPGEVYSDVGAAMLNLSGSHKSRKLEP